MTNPIHPAAFLAGAIACSALWLAFHHLDREPPPAPMLQRANGPVAPQRPLRPDVGVDPTLLARYAGTYVVDGLTVVILVEGGRLVADAGQAGRFELVAASDTKFVLTDFPGEITFDRISGDEVARSFRVDLPSGRSTAVRVGGDAR